MPLTLTLYHRRGCHLCDDMRDALREFRHELAFELRMVDIDGTPELASRYGTLVPVLSLGNRDICHYFLDLPALKSALAQARVAG